MDRIAESAPPGSGWLAFLPWLHGERAPAESNDLRGGLPGFSITSGKGAIIRAVPEGVAYNTRWLIETVRKFTGRKHPYLAMAGGGALLSLWSQTMADVLMIYFRDATGETMVQRRRSIQSSLQDKVGLLGFHLKNLTLITGSSRSSLIA